MLAKVLNSNNKLFELARQGSLEIPRFKGQTLQKIWEVMYPLVAFFYAGLVPGMSAFCVAPVIVVNLASEEFSRAAFNNPTHSNSPLITTMFLLFSFLPFFAFIWGWLGIFEHRSFWTTGLEREGIWKKYSRGAWIGTALMIIPIIVLVTLGYVKVESDPQVWSGWSAIPGVIIMLVGWLAQGAAEETLTRGFLLPVFGIRFGPSWGIIVSSILFSSLHLLNPNVNLIAVLNLFLFGIFACIYAMKEGGLWGIFAIHSFWNWTQGNLLGLEVSGSSIGGTALINLRATGPDLFTGGAFGPEGGLAITITLLAACAILVYRISRKPLLSLQTGAQHA